MKDSNTPDNFSQSQKDDIPTLAPAIIDEVAFMLMSDRPHTETDIDLRFGNKGSFSVNKRLGTFYDFEQAVGGGLLKMICHLTHLEHEKQAVDWLREKGFIDGTFTPAERTHQPKEGRQQTRDMFKAGLKLWNEAKPIPFYQHHPVRRWCRHRNLFPGNKELPPTIRWHEGKGYIIVALAPLRDFNDAYPKAPEPRQFHLIAITKEGQKRHAFKGKSDKRTWGRPSVTCIALFGNPMAASINICEGVADALSIFARSPGTTLASITTFHKIKNCPSLITHLTAEGRSVTLFSDNDDAGRSAQNDLGRTLYEQGGDVFVHENPMAKDPAQAAEQEGKDE